MIRYVLGLLGLFILSPCFSQNIIWSEDFGTSGCNQGTVITSYSSPNGAWTVTDTGANEVTANLFYVSGTASNTGENNCSANCPGGSDPSLHVGAQANLITAADPGALYLETDALTCSILGICAATSKRAESPVISTVGETGLELSFLYFEGGNTQDNANLWVNYGGGWQLLVNLAKTTNCGASGRWTNYSIALPNDAEGIADLQIGFEWTNNSDGIASDPSFAVDDIVITAAEEEDPCPWDFNNDTFINGADLVILLAEFGCMACPLTDVNGSGTTDGAELVGFLAQFGAICD